MQRVNGAPVTDAGPDQPLTDEMMLAALRSGDERACEAFVRRHTGRMLAVARRFLRCEQDAADAVQDAFMMAFRSVDRFAGESRLSTWLHRIVINACLMKLRAERSRPATSIEPLLPTFDETGHHAGRISAWCVLPSQGAEAAELRAAVRKCVNQLPDSYRAIIMLRDIEELDTQETADRLGISAGAAKVRLHRARQALRTLLDPVLRADSNGELTRARL